MFSFSLLPNPGIGNIVLIFTLRLSATSSKRFISLALENLVPLVYAHFTSLTE